MLGLVVRSSYLPPVASAQPPSSRQPRLLHKPQSNGDRPASGRGSAGSRHVGQGRPAAGAVRLVWKPEAGSCMEPLRGQRGIPAGAGAGVRTGVAGHHLRPSPARLCTVTAASHDASTPPIRSAGSTPPAAPSTALTAWPRCWPSPESTRCCWRCRRRPRRRPSRRRCEQARLQAVLM